MRGFIPSVRTDLLGFEKSDLKTLELCVDPEFESYEESPRVYRQRLTGYRFRHSMKLEFAPDNALLGKLLFALAHSGTEPEFSIGYFFKDREKAKNLLLQSAVADAREKANVLATASGVRLCEITRIEYSFENADFTAYPMRGTFGAGRMLAKNEAQSSFRVDMAPEDVTLDDTVTVIWRIS